MNNDKISFKGNILSVQPRIRLTRSFDERSHSYLGYVLRLNGLAGDAEREFSVGIGNGAQEKHRVYIGDEITGECLPVSDQSLETAEYYKVSKLKKTGHIQNNGVIKPPPWETVPPDLEIYRQRGHRRLSVVTYDTKCTTCIWGCKMPVEIIIDNWNPSQRKYRVETFCYGPLSCNLYKAGATRKVEGRNHMIWEEENWVDDEATGHRELDE